MAKKTHEEFVKEVEKKGNGEYEVLDKYQRNDIYVLMKHKICNHEWKVKPKDFVKINGTRCPNCSSKKMKSDEYYMKLAFDKHGAEYTILEVIRGKRIKFKVKHNCEKCNNYEFEVRADHFLRNDPTKCPKCNPKKKKTHEEFVKEVEEKGNGEYEVLGKYINSDVKIEMRHTICNHTYNVLPRSFSSGNRCPYCALNGDSEGIKIIENYLLKNDIIYRREESFETCRNILLMPFDFFIPGLNLLVEFDGEGHFIPGSFGASESHYEEQVYRDQLKNQWCKNNNITLLRIPYTESTNIEIILENFMNNLTDTLSNYDLYYQIEGNEIIQGIYQNN